MLFFNGIKKKAIDSGYLEDITKALDELGIAYEQTKTGVKKMKPAI